MDSLVRRMRKCKRCLGEVRVLRREEYQELELSAEVELIRRLIPLGLMRVQMLLQEELEALAGPRCAREGGAGGLRSGGTPGRGGLGGQRIRRRAAGARRARAATGA